MGADPRKWQVLITSRSFGSVSPRAYEVLAEGGCEAAPNPYGGPLTAAQLVELVPTVDALIVGTDPIDDTVLGAAGTLKIVCKHGTGVDNIDIAAALGRGVAVANVPQANVNAVADITVGALIAVSRSLVPADASVRRGEWKRFFGTELWQKTLGIVGFGAIGQAVARRAAGFEMRILAYDPFFNSKAGETLGVRQATLEELMAESDFISIHSPITKQTRGLIGAAQFAMMKKGAYLVNYARGGIVDEQALIQALREGIVAGAALDVYDKEPPLRDNELFKMENVLVSPHMAAYTREAVDLMSVTAARNVVEFLRDGTCKNLIRQSVGA